MAGETVLIAAFSGRALAQSARRAGYEPLVVDCFGDEDMQTAAAASTCLPARVEIGFRPKSLLAALSELARKAPSPPIGLVLGSGFECNPGLVERLAGQFVIIGNTADVIRRAKDPAAFFGTLDQLGVPHPEVRLSPPDASADWLMKRVGGSGGIHIHDCPAEPRPDPRRYFQRRIPGAEISLLGVVGSRGQAFAVSRQWCAPLDRPRRPYRFGGAAVEATIDPELEARLLGIARDVSRELGLRGLVSFDFLVEAADAPALIEVNPRPGATLDLFEDAEGTLFTAHVEACRDGDPAALLAARWKPPGFRAAALLYADRGPLTAPAIDWPQWAHDRPRAGTTIARHQPLATVTASGPTPDAAERLCRERLGALECMLYEVMDKEGTTPT